jgi:hypothetical protein
VGNKTFFKNVTCILKNKCTLSDIRSATCKTGNEQENENKYMQNWKWTRKRK